MYYTKLITELTGITGEQTLALIEDCMRNDVFHSTLDWQTLEEFEVGAIKAISLLVEEGVI